MPKRTLSRRKYRGNTPPPSSILVTHAVAAGITGCTTVLPGPAEQTLPPGIPPRRALYPVPRTAIPSPPRPNRKSFGRRTSEQE